jgi:tetratricopeptide (TPR) repeat protein
VAFGPDGRRLVSASIDDRIRVWEASPVPAEVLRQRDMVRRVDALFDKLLLRAEVINGLRGDPALSEAERDFALQLAGEHEESPGRLDNAAWATVKTAGLDAEAYALALRQAEAAVRLAPGDGNILNTLGIAQYRARRYAEAAATLARSEKLNEGKDDAHAADLAFLAMAQHWLGRTEEARATLGRLREARKRWADNAQAHGFLREAESLIQGPPGKPEPR